MYERNCRKQGGFALEWPWRQRQRLRLSGRRPWHYANIVRFNEARSPWSAPTHSALGAQRMREAPDLCGTSLGEESLVSSPASSLGLSPASLPRMRTLRKPLQKTPTCWERDGWKGAGDGGGGVGVDQKERRREKTSEKGAGKIMGEKRGETRWRKIGV